MIQDLKFSHQNDLIGHSDFELPFLSIKDAMNFRRNDNEVISTEESKICVEPCSLSDNKKYTAFSQKNIYKLRSKKTIGIIGFSLIIEKEQVVLPAELNQAFLSLSKQEQVYLKHYINGKCRYKRHLLNIFLKDSLC